MRVHVTSQYSTTKALNVLVPQGSCACPVLFNLYSSTICDHVLDNILLNGYTLQIYVTPMINEMVAIKNLEKSLISVNVCV